MIGNKVFGRQRDDKLIQEVDGALEFLEVFSERIVGERPDRPYYEVEYCRFGIMIVGISTNVDEERHDIYPKLMIPWFILAITGSVN